MINRKLNTVYTINNGDWYPFIWNMFKIGTYLI